MRNDGIKCGKCRGHFDEWLNKNDIKPYLESQDKLFDYFFVLHNDVNKRNEKKLFTKDEAIALFRDKDWNKVAKYYSSKIMFYDKKNLIRKKIIQKCLTKGN